MDRALAAARGRVRAAAALTLAALATGLALPASDGLAAGGRYAFNGGTKGQREQVRLALEASAFDWDLIPAEVQIRIVPGVVPHSRPGVIWLDGRLLSSGEFAWAIVQHEYAHQIDYFLLGESERATLKDALGGQAWCRNDEPGLPHNAYGCERFASTVAWAYWPDAENAYRPILPGDESAAMDPARFRALLESLLAPAAAKRTLLLHPDGERR